MTQASASLAVSTFSPDFVRDQKIIEVGTRYRYRHAQ
jgi:hypothetical protein